MRGVKKLQSRLAPPQQVERVPSQELWFSQPLDHFNPLEEGRWEQRYWTNFDQYVEGGPAMIFIGGEGEASPAWLTYGHWYSLAKAEGAAMFLLEHR
jgi:hypothetical protein